MQKLGSLKEEIPTESIHEKEVSGRLSPREAENIELQVREEGSRASDAAQSTP